MPDTHPAATVRLLRSHDDFHQAVVLQRDAWGLQGDGDVLPTHFMAAWRDWGVMAGCFDDGRLRSAAWAFPTSVDGLYCLHMLATATAARGRGLAEVALRFTCDRLRDRDARALTWTYDAGEAVNAHLYHDKLGALGIAAKRDAYGDTASDLQGRVPAHRVVCLLPLQQPAQVGPARVHVPQSVTLAQARAMPDAQARQAYDAYYQALEQALAPPGRAIVGLERGADTVRLVVAEVQLPPELLAIGEGLRG